MKNLVKRWMQLLGGAKRIAATQVKTNHGLRCTVRLANPEPMRAACCVLRARIE